MLLSCAKVEYDFFSVYLRQLLHGPKTLCYINDYSFSTTLMKFTSIFENDYLVSLF